MIEIPIWIFVMLCILSGIVILLILVGIFDFIKDKILDYVKWKTRYEEYKQFWDEHQDLR